MAFFHGVRASEVPTSIIPPVNTTAGLPVVWGTAPVHLTEDPAAYVNKPVICYDWSEAVAALGYSEDWDSFTLSEVMFSQFQLYCVKPIIFVNVLDPEKHKASVKDAEGRKINDDHEVIIKDTVLLASLKVMAAADGAAALLDTDYTAAWDDNGQLVITLMEGGSLYSAVEIFTAYDRVDATKVTKNDIIGGVSADGASKGLELASSIYTRFAMVPGILAAPGWTHDPTVASVIKAKALTLCGLFRCIVLTDVDTEAVINYTDVNN